MKSDGKRDKDIAVLEKCMKALDKSTSRKMLCANLAFLVDHYAHNPSPQLPEHLKPEAK